MSTRIRKLLTVLLIAAFMFSVFCPVKLYAGEEVHTAHVTVGNENSPDKSGGRWENAWKELQRETL